MHINKTKLKNLLNLSSKLVPVLALSLVTLAIVGGKVSAATNSGSVTLTSQRYYPAANNLLDISSGNSAPFSAPFSAAYILPYSASQLIVNPCTSTPVDMSLTINLQYSGTPMNPSFGYIMVAGIDSSNNIDPNQVSTDTALILNAENQAQSFTATLSNITTPNVGLEPILISQSSVSGSQVVVSVNSLNYTLTYPDGMADCTYPASNQNPVISGSTGSATSTTPSGTTVVTGTSLNASDPDGDTLKFSITAGNNSNYFAIDPDTGNITTTQTGIPAGTYTLTVQVDDGNGGTATSNITITVTSPSPTDSDGDGILNSTEGLILDSDGDGTLNYLDSDSDGDGILDSTEAGSNPSSPIDTDGDTIPDYLDLDSDNDGILDNEEKGTASDSSTKPIDTDKDGTPDYRDLDSDNDSNTDIQESGRNYTDTNNDGKVDGTVNTYGIPSSAANPSDPKKLTSSSFKDTDNNGTPDYIQASSTLAKTGANLTIILTLAVIGLVGGLGLKRVRG